MLLAFHGYNERANVFGVLETTIATKYAIVAPDLPFHGETIWKKDDFTRSDLLEIVRRIQGHLDIGRYSFMGFSLGAQIAQALTPELASSLNQVILLAPEAHGLALAGKIPKWWRKVFFTLSKQPRFFEGMVHLLAKTGIISAGNRQFIQGNTGHSQRSERLFKYWLSAGAFRVSGKKFREAIAQHQIPVQIFYGTEDPLIRPKALQKRFGNIPGAQITGLPVSHRLISPILASHLSA